jgi:hypothetical protein
MLPDLAKLRSRPRILASGVLEYRSAGPRGIAHRVAGVANTLRGERPKRLEGSRFMRWQLYGLLAGGSRERLEVWQFYGPVVSTARSRGHGQNIALGHSREPPAANP